MAYNPVDCYWVVAGSTTQVWSSKRFSYVPLTDATYVAWLAAGNKPSRIGSTEELLEVMQQQVLPVIQETGVAIQSTGTPALNATYGISPQDEINLVSLQAAVAASPSPFPGYYRDVNGVKITMTGPQFTSIAEGLLGFIAAFEDALETLVDGGSETVPTQPVTIP